MLEPARYRNKETQSGTGMLRYRTKLMNADAGDIGLDADAQLLISRQNGNKLGTHLLIDANETEEDSTV
jgi:hypothetical protein